MTNPAQQITPENEQQLYEYFLSLDEDFYAFSIERKDDGRTFSREALEDMRGNLFLFLGARIVKFWETTGKPAHKLNAIVSVTFE